MKIIVSALVLTLAVAGSAAAQSSTAAENELRRLVPYTDLLRAVPGLTPHEYDLVVRQLAEEISSRATRPSAIQPVVPPVPSGRRYLGRLSANPYDPESIANPFGRYGSRFSPDSINNPFGRYGSPYSPYSPLNPYATMPPVIVGRER